MPLLLSSPHQPFSLLFARKYTSPAVGGTSGGGINFTSRTKIAIKRYLFAGENSASALELLCDFRKKNRCFKKKQRQSRISRGTPDWFAWLSLWVSPSKLCLVRSLALISQALALSPPFSTGLSFRMKLKNPRVAKTSRWHRNSSRCGSLKCAPLPIRDGRRLRPGPIATSLNLPPSWRNSNP